VQTRSIILPLNTTCKHYRSVRTLRQHCRCVLGTLRQCCRSVLLPKCLTAEVSGNLFSVVRFYRVTACNETHSIAKAFLSVRPSVCLSVKSVDSDKTKETSNLYPPTFLYHMTNSKNVYPSFPTRRMVSVTKIFCQSGTVRAKTPIFN